MKRPDTSLKSAGRWLAGLSRYITPDLVLNVLLILWCELALFVIIAKLLGGGHHG